MAELGIGPGIEIVASQVLPTYPHVSDEFVRSLAGGLRQARLHCELVRREPRHGPAPRPRHDPRRGVRVHARLFHGAKKLGFPLVRIQSAKPELLRRLLPVAEELELKLAYEIHAPMGPNSPEIMKVRDVYAELDSPLLGFVADFSSTMHACRRRCCARSSAPGWTTRRSRSCRRSGPPTPRCGSGSRSSSRYLHGRDFDPRRLGSFAHLAFNMHGHVAPQEWADIMPQILHVHAKFYDIDEQGNEPAIDYPELVRVFVEGGYRGYWSSEWEGHAFAELGEVDPLVLVRKQHDLIRRSMRLALASV